MFHITDQIIWILLSVYLHQTSVLTPISYSYLAKTPKISKMHCIWLESILTYNRDTDEMKVNFTYCAAIIRFLSHSDVSNVKLHYISLAVIKNN